MRNRLFAFTIASIALSGACTLDRRCDMHANSVGASLPLSFSCVTNSVDSVSRIVTLSISVQNISKDNYTVGSTDPDSDFAIEVFRADGTPAEMSDQGQETESVAPSILNSGQMGSVRSTMLKPLQSMKFEINVSRLYALTQNGEL
jgi:hypothetical protein